jgi:hypothetical protein
VLLGVVDGSKMFEEQDLYRLWFTLVSDYPVAEHVTDVPFPDCIWNSQMEMSMAMRNGRPVFSKY